MSQDIQSPSPPTTIALPAPAHHLLPMIAAGFGVLMLGSVVTGIVVNRFMKGHNARLNQKALDAEKQYMLDHSTLYPGAFREDPER